jgi:DNA repair exonuclease SbcCD nuclease subunit
MAHVLLLHAGPDYFVGEGGGFSSDDLRLVRERVTYLALGHIHKPMLYDGWACNPGSPENCDLNEAHYDRDKEGNPRPRGFAWGEIDPAAEAGKRLVKLEIQSNPRRPVYHLALDCSPFGNKLKDGAAALEKAAGQRIVEQQAPASAAVVIRLAGKINLGRMALDLPETARRIQEGTGVKAVTLDASGINLEGFGPSAVASEGDLSREDIERAAIRNLVSGEHLWGLETEDEAIAGLFFELKEGVRRNQSVEELAERIQLSPLIAKIQAAASADQPLVKGSPP